MIIWSEICSTQLLPAFCRLLRCPHRRTMAPTCACAMLMVNSPGVLVAGRGVAEAVDRCCGGRGWSPRVFLLTLTSKVVVVVGLQPLNQLSPVR